MAAFVTLLIMQTSCSVDTLTDLSKNSIIPLPQSVSATWESFVIRNNFQISLSDETEALRQSGAYLSNELFSLTGLKSEVVLSGKRERRGSSRKSHNAVR